MADTREVAVPAKAASSHREFEDEDEKKIASEDDDCGDGKVNWTLKNIIATASLCGVWTGQLTM